MKSIFESTIVAAILMCSLPSDCTKVLNAEFDAGESGEISNHAQVTCETATGTRTSIAWIMDGWGLIGLNRIAMPNSVQYQPGNGRELSCSKG